MTLSEKAGSAILSVEDNGSGDQSEANTPLSPTPLHSTKGNGLGLGLLMNSHAQAALRWPALRFRLKRQRELRLNRAPPLFPNRKTRHPHHDD